MEDNVIDLRGERAKRKQPGASYFVRIDLYEDGICGEVELPDLSPDDLRNVSNNLFAFARHVSDCAWQDGGSDDDRILSVVRVFESGRVSCWTSNSIDTDERADWLSRRFDDASQASRPNTTEGT